MTMLYTFYNHRTSFVVGKSGDPIPRVAIADHTLHPIPDCAVAVTVSDPDNQPFFEKRGNVCIVFHKGLYWRYTVEELDAIIDTGTIQGPGGTTINWRAAYSYNGLTVRVSDPNDSFNWYDICLYKKSLWDEVGAFFKVGSDGELVYADIEFGKDGDFGSTSVMSEVLSEVFQVDVKSIGDWGQTEYRLGGRYDLPSGIDQREVQPLLEDPIPFSTHSLNTTFERQLTSITNVATTLHSSARYNTVGTLLSYGTTTWRKQLTSGQWKSFIVPLQYYTADLSKFSEQITCLLPTEQIFDAVLCAHVSPVKPTLGTIEVHYKVGL